MTFRRYFLFQITSKLWPSCHAFTLSISNLQCPKQNPTPHIEKNLCTLGFYATPCCVPKQIFIPMQSLLITDKFGVARELPLQRQQLEQSPCKALLQRCNEADRAQQPRCATHRHLGVQEPFVGFVLRSRPPYEDWNSVHLVPSKEQIICKFQ